MTDKEELENMLQMPIETLATLCHDPECLVSVLSYAINIGIKLGHRQITNNMNQAFKGYTAEVIKN